jgi:outer membrane protein assembly factor BamA
MVMAFGACARGLDEDTLKPQKRNRFYGFPILFYLPETRFAIGGVGVYSFRFPNDSDRARPSFINPSFAVTQNKQILLFLPFQLFPKNQVYSIYGELGYYKYNYFFYGIGNENAPNFRERYAVDYPRIRITAQRRISKNTYFGLRYWFEDWKLYDFDPAGKLVQQQISGSKGGRVSGIGTVLTSDSRNNIFSPERGSLFETSIQLFHENTGSEYTFSRFLIDYSKYTKLAPSTVLALHGVADWNFGAPPFSLLAAMGGTKRMRGFYEGRFRDKKLILAQAEIRQHIWWRFGAVAFGGLGIVASEINYFRISQTRYTYGGGIRFMLDEKEKLNIRLDYGRGTYKSSGFYLTIGEAF